MRLAKLMKYSGLLFNDAVCWVTFDGAYDFGYLVKALTHRILPQGLREFLLLIGIYFGKRVYDVKHLMTFCFDLYGGLEGVCHYLHVNWVVRKIHQASSDNLLTLYLFHNIKHNYFHHHTNYAMLKYSSVLYGLYYLHS
ncbi:hypothetical protein VNO77_15870 [Canavalia gladiata]|uniref:Uncharacterized protein n=1 Tax=Canavalia gladiata TaxID=3824 RepID=A0AAN9QRK9_CANGL